MGGGGGSVGRRSTRTYNVYMELSFRGSCNKLDSFTVPTDANVRIACHSSNVNGDPDTMSDGLP